MTIFEMELRRDLEAQTFFEQREELLESLWNFSSSIKLTAMTVAAMPTSQASVERLFSGVHWFKSDVRASMGPALLNVLSFLKTNGCTEELEP